MALNIADKKAIVAQVRDVVEKSVSAIAADYRGLSVTQMTSLRATARQSGVYLRVVRNTLARRAMTGSAFACLQDSLTGPVLLAFSSEEPSAPARLFRDFIKDNEALKVKAIVVDGTLYEASRLSAIAKLPTKEEAIAKLMAVMIAPITKLVQTLAEPQAKLVRTLAAIQDKKQAS